MMKQTIKKFEQSAERALNWLNLQLEKDGSYGSGINDLASYYKSPYLFYLFGKVEEANRILTYLKKNFMQENSDFTMPGGIKSENAAFEEYWAYINAWIALAAQKMGRFDVAYPAYQYLKLFYHPEQGGFKTNKPDRETDNVVDVLTTAHLGLTALYFGELDKARTAGNLLQRFVSLQPNIQLEFYLRINDEGKLITEFPGDSAIFFTVSATQPNQAYFMIGYPIAFLGKLYQATGEDNYLNTAKSYLDFALTCHDSIRTFYFSHKVAWGAAIVANLTKELRYENLSTSIADYLLSIQESEGVWLKDEPPQISFDQTAEIAIWLREISTELSEM
ncbi:MAG: hypothetical protein AB4426_09295 [Xenococcaceae cyanobacterium]